MKLLLASFLLLASVSNSVIAAKPTGKEVLIITSNPQPGQSDGCIPPNCDSSKTIPNIEAQYQWINKNIDRTNLLGVVVNGNWTAPNVDMFKAKELYLKLEVPLYYGIGANDYINNKVSSPGDAILAVLMLDEHIQEIIKKQYQKKIHFDFVKGSQSYQTLGIGSLGYAVELGRENNIYLIQLNDNGNKDPAQFTLDGRRKNGGATNFNVKINPIYDWLQTRLEYAAKTGKKIIVTKNSADIDPNILDLLNKYNVRMRFLGVKTDSSPLCAGYQFVCLGFSTEKELLKLELDYDIARYSVNKLKADSSNDKIGVNLTNGELVTHPPQLNPGVYPVQKQVVIYRNPAWYNGFPSVTYINPISGSDEGFDGSTTAYAMKLNDIFLVDVPIDISRASQRTERLTASYTYNWRDGKQILNDVDRVKLEENVVCIIARGSAGLGYAEIHKSKKMGEGGEIEMLNQCP